MLKYLEPARELPLTMPSELDLRSNEVGPYMRKCLESSGRYVRTEHRMRIMRLLENMSIGNNHRLRELHGVESPGTQIG